MRVVGLGQHGPVGRPADLPDDAHDVPLPLLPAPSTPLPPSGFFREPGGVFSPSPAILVSVEPLRGITRFFNGGARGGLIEPL